MKKILRKLPFYKDLRAFYGITWGSLRNRYTVFAKIRLIKKYFDDLASYKKLEPNKASAYSPDYVAPMIYDNTPNAQGIDVVYFYQDSWCAKKVFEHSPKHHYDIGSKAEMNGIISQFTPTTMVDIRPLEVHLNNLHFVEGNILSLPFEDSSIKSLSSICVIEHIGLGRYGDPLDTFGTEKAAKELSRVLAKGGDLYVSVPIDNANRLYFNAHRAFTREYVFSMFAPLVLEEEKYIYGNSMIDTYDPGRGFGTGLFHFKKI